MTSMRALVIIASVSFAAAILLAVASRTPESVRRDVAPESAFDPSRGASFSAEQIDRHRSYRTPGYLHYVLTLIVEIVTLVVLARGPLARVVDKLSSVPGGFVTRAALVAGFVVLVLTVAALPLAFVRGYAMEHAWGLSTQDIGGWLSDKGKGLLVGTVMAAVAAIAFFGVVRWQPRSWWLWGWAAFSILTAVLAFVWPILIAPLFNKFTPLPDPALAERIKAVADDAGVRVDRVFVADASRRTTAENAYVAGIGASRRVVLYDNLLATDDVDETMFVVAHELGHEAEKHVLKNVGLSSIGLFAGFLVLYWLSRKAGFWAWAGAEGISDLKAVPLLLLFALAAGVLTTPLESAVSRSFERRADEIAFELTGDPRAAVGMFRRLAFRNIADLRPPKAVEATLYTHPPIPDRIRAALESPASNP